MKISTADVARIAHLSRLDLPEDKLETFAHQLSDVLDYMETLAEVDTSGVEPLYSPSSHSAPLRADVAERTLTREELLAGAPEQDGKFFIVPKVV